MGFKSFNIKKVSKKGWIILGSAVAIMIAALIFKPDFTQTQGYIIAGVIIAWIAFEVLKMTGVLGKIFNKKK